MSTERLYLGFDSSTQGLKAVAVDARLDVVAEFAVNYDARLPEFRTQGGVHRDGLAVTSPPLMWVAALDLLLEDMKRARFPFGRVVAVSGSGQQHGSVYLRSGARTALHGLDPAQSLRAQVDGLFSVPASPVWMDSSTGRECRQRDEGLGGPQAVAERTGSRSYERFTGNQIAKIRLEQPSAYGSTERIALVSSFMASLLVGDYAPIDAADGAGMNLMDIRTRRWDAGALAITGPDLAAKLGDLVPSHQAIGAIHAYYVRRYGFDAACRVVAFSGDNPCSLAGLRLQDPGCIAISLGTSDTVFGSLANPRPSATEGHIFANPVDPAAYMALICYKNGSLTRERIRDEQAGGSWDRFSGALESTPPGNDGHIGFYILEPEITPPILKTGVHRFDPLGRPVSSFPPAVAVRSVVEGQFLSMRLHGEHVGLHPRQILATGGASANRAILRVMADVFGVPVFVGEQPNSAALGAAYRAIHGWKCAQDRRFVPFAEIMAPARPFQLASEPAESARAVYDAMLPRYAELERRVLALA